MFISFSDEHENEKLCKKMKKTLPTHGFEGDFFTFDFHSPYTYENGSSTKGSGGGGVRGGGACAAWRA